MTSTTTSPARLSVTAPFRGTAQPPPLLVFSDDWGGHPSSCQHLVRCLLPEWEVHWVNMIGMRRPGLDRTTLRRGTQKIREWLAPPPEASEPARGSVPGPELLNPKLWPGFGYTPERRLNRWLLERQLRPVLRSLPRPPVAVTTTPVVADLLGRVPVARWVYYCVDDFTQWPGIDHAAVARLEDVLIDRADVIVAVGEVLREKIARRGRGSELLSHGVDLDFWKSSAPAEMQADLAGPLVVFWGLIDRRIDTGFVRRLADELDGGTILFVGPTDSPDPALARLPRVRLSPAVPLSDLPGLAAAADVLIMPYADLPVTRAMQPLKLKEYLATGKPVVARDLPANRAWADSLDLADSPERFSAAVRSRLRDGLSESQLHARSRLANESWPAKAREFADALLENRTNFSAPASSAQ